MDELESFIEYARENSRFISFLEIALNNLSCKLKNNMQKYVELYYDTWPSQDYIIDLSKKIIILVIGEIPYEVDIKRIRQRIDKQNTNKKIDIESVENAVLSEITTTIRKYFDLL